MVKSGQICNSNSHKAVKDTHSFSQMIQIYRSKAEKVIAAEPTNSGHDSFPKSEQSDSLEKGYKFQPKIKTEAI